MYPSQPASSNVRPPQRILLVGCVVELFRDVLYLSRDVRPTWFFEVAATPEAAARMLDDHEVDAVVAGISRDGGLVLQDTRSYQPGVRRVAIMRMHHESAEDVRPVTVDPRASPADQLAALDAVLSPQLRRSA